jgi:hypothetical protein
MRVLEVWQWTLHNERGSTGTIPTLHHFIWFVQPVESVTYGKCVGITSCHSFSVTSSTLSYTASGAVGLDLNIHDNDNNNPALTTVYTWRDWQNGDPFPSKIPSRWGELCSSIE